MSAVRAALVIRWIALACACSCGGGPLPSPMIVPPLAPGEPAPTCADAIIDVDLRAIGMPAPTSDIIPYVATQVQSLRDLAGADRAIAIDTTLGLAVMRMRFGGDHVLDRCVRLANAYVMKMETGDPREHPYVLQTCRPCLIHK